MRLPDLRCECYNFFNCCTLTTKICVFELQSRRNVSVCIVRVSIGKEIELKKRLVKTASVFLSAMCVSGSAILPTMPVYAASNSATRLNVNSQGPSNAASFLAFASRGTSKLLDPASARDIARRYLEGTASEYDSLSDEDKQQIIEQIALIRTEDPEFPVFEVTTEQPGDDETIMDDMTEDNSFDETEESMDEFDSSANTDTEQESESSGESSMESMSSMELEESSSDEDDDRDETTSASTLADSSMESEDSEKELVKPSTEATEEKRKNAKAFEKSNPEASGAAKESKPAAPQKMKRKTASKKDEKKELNVFSDLHAGEARKSDFELFSEKKELVMLNAPEKGDEAFEAVPSSVKESPFALEKGEEIKNVFPTLTKEASFGLNVNAADKSEENDRFESSSKESAFDEEDKSAKNSQFEEESSAPSSTSKTDAKEKESTFEEETSSERSSKKAEDESSEKSSERFETLGDKKSSASFAFDADDAASSMSSSKKEETKEDKDAKS